MRTSGDRFFSGTFGPLAARKLGIELAEDGSLSILVGPTLAGGADPVSPNRLVTPTGSFSLYLRIYWPDGAVLDGSWTPPPVHRDEESVATDRADILAAVIGSVAAPAPEERPSAAAAKASGVAVVPPSRAGGAKGRRGRFVRSSDREVVRRR